jgi:diguanylate cyclase (GGDEF)-like protein/PAS domain S-box-containing protein
VAEALRVLLVEDSENDALLTLRQLRKGGYEPSYTRVDSADTMREALAAQPWDVVLSDYNMPGFSGYDALALLQDSGVDLPFIIISGAIGEETAVEVMRAGAHDYIMKDNLARLVPAVERELREAQVRGAKREAEANLQLAATVFEASMEGLVITDSEARILRANKAFSEITGYAEHEVVGRNPNLLRSGRHNNEFYRKMWMSITTQGYWQGEIWNRRKNGEVFPEWLTISAVKNSQGEVEHFVAGFTDLSQKKQAEDRIQYLMYYDALTDLPNRALFQERFKQYMLRAQRDQKRVAYLHLDLDRFVTINDTLGHQKGDQLLQQVGRRLVNSVNKDDVVARLSGDEFAIAIPNIAYDEDVESYLLPLLEAFAEPFQVVGQEIFLVPSIGVVMFPEDSDRYDELVRFGDTAVHVAKQGSGASYQLYQKTMNVDAAQKLDMENALRRALERKEYRLHYQPQIAMHSGEIIGVEALLRWERQGVGMVLPGQFIPLLEETGLIISVGEWVIRQACSDQQAWLKAGLPPLHVALNISPQQFRDKGLVDMIFKVLQESGSDPQGIELEITESSVMESPDTALQILGALHEKGVRIAVDDFGTGYSSLSYLKRFPLDVLKIDQSFVADVPGDEDDVAIVDTIIAMAHRLKLSVIAEGVENAEQAGFLREHDCDNVQGYYYGRPMPAEDIVALLSAAK